MSNESTITFWVNNKNKIYGAILVIVGALGGNVDRVVDVVESLLPYETTLKEMDAKINDNSKRIEELIINNELLVRQKLEVDSAKPTPTPTPTLPHNTKPKLQLK